MYRGIYWICALISFLNFIGLAIKLNLFVTPPVVTIIEPKPKIRPIILWLIRSPSHLLKINSRASRLKIPDFRIPFYLWQHIQLPPLKEFFLSNETVLTITKVSRYNKWYLSVHMKRKLPVIIVLSDIRIYTSEYLLYILFLHQLVGCFEYSS